MRSAERHPEGETRSQLLGSVARHLPALSRRIVERMQEEMPAYAALTPEDLLPGVSTNLELMLPAMRTGRPFSDEEMAAFTRHGESRALQGVSIEELLRGWRLGTQAMVDEMLDSARETGVDEGLVLELTRGVLAAADLAVVAAALGHRQAELRSDRQEQRRRVDLVRGTLLGTLGPAEMVAGVRAYGLDPDREYRAIRAVATPEVPADQLEQRLGLSPGATRGLTALVDGDLCGFLDSPPSERAEVSVGVGPTASLDALASSFQHASRAASTAAAFGLAGVYDLPRLGLLPAVLTDDDVGEEMVRRYVTPASAGSGGEDLLRTVRSYLAHDMRVDRTAEALFVHQNTVRYRLNRYQEVTGANLRNPHDVLEVWWGLRRHHLSDGD